ncbi:TetR/AcrR family transcriptional regulator [Amycolatopsis sp. GM8]|uniref:TetR/AcrR family transcriptional regulator n=1 Tax=Amycolatopsis sp. GM8 TaxID=2896530 RepID=UPI001F297C20|nr:TetR/AcrR family transcriptional regulator [Amycolatopsis sp. GM8]
MATGRPRGFDTDVALERALHVFWRKGYEGASLADLTKEMGINAPSMYAAFGDKQTLFYKVLERYASEPGVEASRYLDLPTARAAVENLLRSTVERATDPATPPGCLLVHGALVTGRTGQAVRDELAARRNGDYVSVRQRLERAVEEGDLPAGTDPAVLARYVITVSDGIAVAAVDGATPDELNQVVDVALQGWPTKGRSGVTRNSRKGKTTQRTAKRA